MKDAPARYEIRIQDHLAPRRLDCFAHLAVIHRPDGSTHIEGTMDPAALYGLLNHLSNLGATLLFISSSW